MLASCLHILHYLVAMIFAYSCTIMICSAGECSSHNTATAGFENCLDLKPATLAWTYMDSNNTVSIAYTDTALSPSGWVGWGINFNGTSMVNSDAIVAFKQPNGSATAMRYTLTTAIYDNMALPLTPVENFSLQILDMSALITGTSFTILAVVRLPINLTSINTVYNRGPSVFNNVPAPHNQGQRNGMQTIDLTTGTILSSTYHSPHNLLRNMHGVLSIASWGILLILGAMTARYMKQVPSADPAWFYMHVALQTSAYMAGMAAWGMGIRLGTLSPGVEYHSHRNMAFVIIALASLQMMSLLLRPHKRHDVRMYWNIYHHALGYSILILGVVNIFKGFDILEAPERYKVMYIAFLVAVACASLVMEAASWHHFFRHRRRNNLKQSQVAGFALGSSSAVAAPKWDFA